MKSSRSSANTFSPSTNDAAGDRVSTVCASDDAGEGVSAMRSTVASASPPSLTVVDQAAEQPRPGQPGERGERVQPEHHGRARAAVLRANSRRASPRGPPRRPATGSVVAPRRLGPRSSSSCLARRVTSSPRMTARGTPASLAEQLAVGALGDHPAGVQEDDVVGVVEQQRAGGDHHRGAAGAGAARSRSAIRASVCASTALVGSTSTRTRRVGEQRPRQREPLPLAAGERAAALVDLAVQPVRQRVEHVVRGGGVDGRGRTRRRRCRRRPSSWRAQRPGEQAWVALADHHVPAHRVQRQQVEPLPRRA